MSDLPERSHEAEDAFVARFRDGQDEAGLEEAIAAAVEARRPLLAARLVGLLDDEAGPELERACRAAALVLHQGLGPEDVSWSALDDALRELRDRRMARTRARWERARSGRDDGMTRTPRLGSRNRRS